MKVINTIKPLAVTLFLLMGASTASASACGNAEDNLRAVTAQFAGAPLTNFGRMMIREAQNEVLMQCESGVIGGE